MHIHSMLPMSAQSIDSNWFWFIYRKSICLRYSLAAIITNGKWNKYLSLSIQMFPRPLSRVILPFLLYIYFYSSSPVDHTKLNNLKKWTKSTNNRFFLFLLSNKKKKRIEARVELSSSPLCNFVWVRTSTVLPASISFNSKFSFPSTFVVVGPYGCCWPRDAFVWETYGVRVCYAQPKETSVASIQISANLYTFFSPEFDEAFDRSETRFLQNFLRYIFLGTENSNDWRKYWIFRTKIALQLLNSSPELAVVHGTIFRRLHFLFSFV